MIFIKVPSWLITGFAVFAFLKWGVNPSDITALCAWSVKNAQTLLIGFGCATFAACTILGKMALGGESPSIIRTAATAFTGLAVVFIGYLLVGA